jgi:hypothetical protein
MGDPDRLLGGQSDGDELERQLLGSIRDVSPPPGAKGESWDVIAVQVAVVAAVGASTAVAGSAAAAGAGAKLFTAKVLIGVALVGSTFAAGGYWVSRHLAEGQVAQRSVAARAARLARSGTGPTAARPDPRIGDGAM